MKALVLEKKLDLSLREFEIENQCDFDNVKIKSIQLVFVEVTYIIMNTVKLEILL